MTAAPLRIVFFGTPEFAVPSLEALLASRHQVAALVSQPDRPRGRGQRLVPTETKAAAGPRGVPVLQPLRIRDETFLSQIRALAPDLGVVAAYGRILPASLLEIPRLGMVNVHASLLPRYRGAAPVHRAVMAGEIETGVTIMRVVEQLDAGGMFAKAARPIGPDETSAEVERALAGIGAGLLLEVIEALAAGDAAEEPQDDSQATYAPKITREDGVADWSLPARRLHDRVRGLHPWPLVSVRLEAARCLLHRTKVLDEPTDSPPGSVVHAAGGRLTVAAGDGRLLALELIQPEGRRPMTAREFLAGRRIPPGSRIESP